MLPIGIMQGRLGPPESGRFQSFPRLRWADEFDAARQAGLDRIEWIYDQYSVGGNPIETDAGCARILELSQSTGVLVRSLVADYFMDWPLVRAGDDLRGRIEKLIWLIGRSALLGIQRVTLPFVDASRIETPADSDAVVAAIHHALPTAIDHRIEIHLETSLNPDQFAKLLARIPHELVKVNYDSGNSASLGYNVGDEFAAYGNRVGSIHIKDRVRGGGTVPLGTGNTDLPALIHAINSSAYRRDLILQVARGTDGDEVAWSNKNRLYVTDLIQRAALDHKGTNP
jgi:hexulose-6-phosphate isomerase